ncbi:hypothetical protein AMECASPLE_035884 [Ameca splendens]|uniref:Uncharacterized protein n=1 Tax=Ameca splendens TaxID=208324 RepID=A0ABV0ZTW8_9TELE
MLLSLIRCGSAPLDHISLNRLSNMRKRYRNGLGPSKEGEAQYSVVHCTGYIKAWPPAGKQMFCSNSWVYPHISTVLEVSHNIVWASIRFMLKKCTVYLVL